MKYFIFALFAINASAMTTFNKEGLEVFPGRPVEEERVHSSVEQYFAQLSNRDEINRISRQQSAITTKSNDTVIHISQDSEGTEDTIPLQHHKKRMYVSNGITAIIVCSITSGVALAIHFIK